MYFQIIPLRNTYQPTLVNFSIPVGYLGIQRHTLGVCSKCCELEVTDMHENDCKKYTNLTSNADRWLSNKAYPLMIIAVPSMS